MRGRLLSLSKQVRRPNNDGRSKPLHRFLDEHLNRLGLASGIDEVRRRLGAESAAQKHAESGASEHQHLEPDVLPEEGELFGEDEN